MNWLNKLERKFGKFAISNLMKYVLGMYVLGYALRLLFPGIAAYLVLSPHHILQGQVWRLITWIMMPSDTNIFFLLIMVVFYYQLGTTLERFWGTFRFNIYILGGMLFTLLGAFLLYGLYSITGNVEFLYGNYSAFCYSFSMEYVYMSIFLAFATMFPNEQVLLMMILPIKMKWMAYVYVGMTVFLAISSGWPARVQIIMSLLNFIIFFFTTRNYHRVSPKEIHRRKKFHSQMRQPRNGITRHKCAICGRTEKDDPNLEFRFCSKCDGNYEYCQEHLFTHTHIHKN